MDFDDVGSVFQVAYTFVILLIGFMALAMALQGADFINPKISIQRRIVFVVAALNMLLPLPKWVNILGLILMIGGWLPGFVVHRKTVAASKI